MPGPEQLPAEKPSEKTTNGPRIKLNPETVKLLKEKGFNPEEATLADILEIDKLKKGEKPIEGETHTPEILEKSPDIKKLIKQIIPTDKQEAKAAQDEAVEGARLMKRAENWKKMPAKKDVQAGNSTQISPDTAKILREHGYTPEKLAPGQIHPIIRGIFEKPKAQPVPKAVEKKEPVVSAPLKSKVEAPREKKVEVAGPAKISNLTKDMLSKNGYTAEQIATLKEGEVWPVISKIIEKTNVEKRPKAKIPEMTELKTVSQIIEERFAKADREREEKAKLAQDLAEKNVPEEQMNMDLGNTSRQNIFSHEEKIEKPTENISEEPVHAEILENKEVLLPKIKKIGSENKNKVELTKEEKIAKIQAERYGFKEKNLAKSVSKGFLNTIGSIFGVRLAWELPKMISGIYKKGKAKESTIDLLNSVDSGTKDFKKLNGSEQTGKNEKTEKSPNAVQEKIMRLNERLKNIELPAAEKKQLRGAMAEILKKYKNSSENVDKKKNEEIAKVFDVYASNSAQIMAVAKEAVNTVSIFTFMPWLRSAGYLALSGAESYIKASNIYDKKHFGDESDPKEKLSYVARAVTVGSAKETYNGIIGNFFNKENKDSTSKKVLVSAGATASAVFSLMRLAGVVEFEHAMQAGGQIAMEGREKFFDALKGGNFTEALKQGGENWIHNTERLLSYLHITKNPNEEMKALIRGKEAASQASAEKIKENIELATIHKGEGIENTFIRQIEHNAKAFGYKGDLSDKAGIHHFAQIKADQIAIENHYVDVDKATEVRVGYDAKNPSAFLLQPDHSVREINPHKYVENSGEEFKNVLSKENRINEIAGEATKTNLSVEHGVAFESGRPVELHRVSNIWLDNNDNLYHGRTPFLQSEQNFGAKGDIKIPAGMKTGAMERIHYVNNAEAEESLKNFKSFQIDTEPLHFGMKGEAKFIRENNTIVGLKYTDTEGGVKEYKEKFNMLKDDWGRTLFSKFDRYNGLAEKKLELSLSDIFSLKKILKKLESLGKGGSDETRFVTEKIKKATSAFKNNYGDILK